MCSDERTLKINKYKFFISFHLPPVSCCLLSLSPKLPYLSTLWSISPQGLERWIQVSKKLFSKFVVVIDPSTVSPCSPPALDKRKRTSPLPPPPYRGRSWTRICPSRFFLSLLLLILSRRASRRCWLSWWRCHQSQKGGWGSGKGQGSEREGPWPSAGEATGRIRP